MTAGATTRSGRPSRPDYVSASAIGKYLDCERMWGFRYIEGLEEPETAAQKLGKQVHASLEHYFKLRLVPDLNTRHGEIARMALKHYPAPHKGMLVEEEISFEFDSVRYLGFVDLMYAVDERTISINDHKSTTDFKWMKTEEILRRDPQAVLYSAWATIAYNIEVVTLQWTYLRTNPPYQSRVVTLTWTRDEIWEAMEEIHAVAKKIVASRKKKVTDLAPDLSACGKYRGCAYKDRCIGQMSATERMRASFRSAERRELAQKLKHEPSTTERRHLKIVENQPQQQQRERTKHMGLLANLRKNAPTEGSSTTTSSGKNGAAAARPVLARAGAGAAAAPKAKPTLLRGAKTETPASQVSEDHEPPEHSEPPVEPPEQRRTRGPNKAKGSNSAEVLAMFHVAAIKAGLSPEFAQEHYQAWQAATAG